MSFTVMCVKCKNCETPIPVKADSPRETGDDGVNRVRLTCPRCRKETTYRVASGAPAAGPAPEVRLPRIVLDAAWWLKFTLISGWIAVCACIAVPVFGFLIMVVVDRHYRH